MKNAVPLLGLLLLAGCAGKLDYARPSTPPGSANNTKIIDKPRAAVWNSSVPELGKQFFVINNLDKSSGLINVSYNGDPEKYIDCGRVTSYVKNARGERTYDFPASRANQQYEVMGNGLFFINRKLSLEGRVNLIFEEVNSNQTRVTANTRYMVTRQVTVSSASNHIPHSATDSISLNSGGSASFPANATGQGTECVSTGALEKEILSVIK